MKQYEISDLYQPSISIAVRIASERLSIAGFEHSSRVANLVDKYFTDRHVCITSTICAAYLHDVIEDTFENEEEGFEFIAQSFEDYRVARLVLSLTDKKGKNRKQRKLLTYSRIRSGGEDAILVKLCDRLDNRMRSATAGDYAHMYDKEYYTFKCALWNSDNDFNADLWTKLDKEHNFAF